MHILAQFLLVVILLVGVAARPALGGAYSWTGAGNGVEWNDPDNWSPVGVPGFGDDATFGSGFVFMADGPDTSVRSITFTTGCFFIWYDEKTPELYIEIDLTVDWGGLLIAVRDLEIRAAKGFEELIVVNRSSIMASGCNITFCDYMWIEDVFGACWSSSGWGGRLTFNGGNAYLMGTFTIDLSTLAIGNDCFVETSGTFNGNCFDVILGDNAVFDWGGDGPCD